MTKLHQAIVAGLAASCAFLGAAQLAPAQTIIIGSWENLVTPPPPDPVPLPNFFRRPIGSAGTDGTHDFDNRSVYASDTFGATNGSKSLKVMINPNDTGGRFSFNLNLQVQEVGGIGNFLASGMFAIDVSFRNDDFNNGGAGNGYAGINQLAVNSVGTGVGFLDRGKATADSWRDAHVTQPDSFRGFWDKSVGDNTTTLTWDLTDLVDGNAANNEVGAVQANNGGGFLGLVLSTVYDSAFDPSTAAFRFDNARFIPRVVSSEWTGLAPDPDNDGSNGNAATGLWHASQNWTLGVAGAYDSVATFGTNGGALVGAQTVNTNQSTPIGTINFNNAAGYTIGGTGSLTLRTNTGPAGINVQAGSHAINVSTTIGSDATITVTPAGSTLTISNLQSGTAALTKSGAGVLAVNAVRGGALTVNAGTLRVIANGTDSGTSRVSTLTIAGGATPTATLDLKDNDLIVTSGTYAAVTDAIAFARHGGAWDRAGLTSSSAASATPKNKTLGTLTGAEFHQSQGASATFDGFTVANSDLLVKYTYYGDADLNGQVNFDDYSRIDAGFNNNRTGWFNGDFDYSGSVNFDDYSLIDNAFNTQSGTLRRAMSYLEGGDRSDRGMDTPALQLVMEHFAQFGQPYATGFLNAVPEPTGALAISGLVALAAGQRRRRASRK
ncbi:hypothetical protein BH09PLA1_BH09PLA1_12020 [soil metagenome]